MADRVGPTFRMLITVTAATLSLGLFHLPFVLSDPPHGDAPVKRLKMVLEYIDVAPFGINRRVIAVNGKFPSPTIELVEGDRLLVEVVNKLPYSTAVHWHGLRQRFSKTMDGVPYVTQQPILPNETYVYDIYVEESGSFWYHAHGHGQLLEGLRGPLIVYEQDSKRGPKGTDLVLALSDWYQAPIDHLLMHDFMVPESEGREPVPNAALVNGIAQFGCQLRPVSSTNGSKPVCKYARLVAKKGGSCAHPTVHMRVISMAGFAAFNVSVDGHEMQIVAVDSIPVSKAVVGHLRINTGQRYDVMLCRTGGLAQGDGGYWVRVQMDQDVYFEPSLRPTTLAILQYTSSQNVFPISRTKSQQYAIGDHLTETGRWLDPYGLTSVIHEVVEAGLHPLPPPTVNLTLTIIFAPDPVTNVTMATFNGVPWRYEPPAGTETLLSRVLRGDETPFPPEAPTYRFKVNDIVLINLNNTDEGEHPIHLHGQPFFVLAQGRADDGPWDPVRHKLNMENPLLRDTATINAKSYMVLLFAARNPGVWMFHCHIEWHMASGLMALFRVDP